MNHQYDMELAGRPLRLETGELAQQAGGAVTLRYGDTMLLATVTASEPRRGIDFFPLSVEFEERLYAAGRIPGSFFRREGRPTTAAVLSARLTDRPLRPLFPSGYFYETQIISLVLSADQENDPDILAINGASTALVLSDIPFYHPVGAVRVGLIDDEIVFNPTGAERDVSDLDLIVVGTEDAVTMVEAGANQLDESVVLDCIFAGHQELQKVVRAQQELFREMDLEKPDWEAPEAYSPEFRTEVENAIWDDFTAALNTPGKFERRDAVKAVVKGFVDRYPEDDERRGQVGKIVNELEDKALREIVMKQGKRFDNRALDEVRALDTETGLLPRVHGSALFTRGETQALASVTLGTRRDAQIIEEYEGETHQKFLLHYNFPPFSVGEVRFLRGSSRREIGHGVLARRALVPVLPHEDDFPYTVRVVSEILESNGSSSMATVCSGSLALFDAGVPMLAPVAGVAMGLVKDGDDFAVLTDIAGQEDHHGDMDFKVAGTRGGITALQMDIKIAGVTREIMGQALTQAREGRLHILDHMASEIEEPREEMSAYAPRLHVMMVARDRIRDVIGPGGKTIRGITEETGCQIDIEDDGRVVVASPNSTSAERAIAMIERLTEVPEVDKVYTGQVRRVEPFGAFVEILPGTDGLVHISELAPYRVGEIGDLVTEGDEMTVKVIDIDPSGKVRLSRKAVIMDDPDFDPKDYEGMGVPAPVGGDRDRGRDRRGPGGRGGRGGPGGRGGRGGGPGGRGRRPRGGGGGRGPRRD